MPHLLKSKLITFWIIDSIDQSVQSDLLLLITKMAAQTDTDILQ